MDGTNMVNTARALGVNPHWLATGKGEKSANHIRETPKAEYALNHRGIVPLISWVSAGAWCEVIDVQALAEAETRLPCPIAHGSNTYALRVVGDSMTSPYPNQRSYQEGAIIFVDPDRAITNGCRVVAKLTHSEEATFKEYREDGGKRYLKPLNPQYKMQEITEDTRLCGVVIGQFIAE